MKKIRQQPFTHAAWLNNIRRSALIAVVIISSALLLGVMGYHYIGRMHWVDALLEASMILGGMGPIAPMHDSATKLFASFYALFSSFIVLSSTGLLLAPWVHRLIYHTHRQARHDAIVDESNR